MGEKPPQFPIFVFEQPDASDFIGQQVAVLASPTVVGLAGDAMSPASLADA
jgi:hypothetical protein